MFYFFILFLLFQATEKTVLDGTSPPVQTIIFENTNYKSTPDLAMKAKFSSHMKHQRSDKPRGERNVLVYITCKVPRVVVHYWRSSTMQYFLYLNLV